MSNINKEEIKRSVLEKKEKIKKNAQSIELTLRKKKVSSAKKVNKAKHITPAVQG